MGYIVCSDWGGGGDDDEWKKTKNVARLERTKNPTRRRINQCN